MISVAHSGVVKNPRPEIRREIKKAPFVRVDLPQAKKTTGKKLILTNEIDKIILAKKLSRTQLSKLVCKDKEGTALNKPVTGVETMSDNLIKKLAPVIEVSEQQIKSWILADKYSLETLELALNLHK